MVSSKTLKSRTGPRKSNFPTNISCLPQELLIEVVARVASSSTADLVNLKTTSRYLSTVSNDGYVLQHASMDKIPRDMWPLRSHGARTFLGLCKKYGNPEALFRDGVFEYFSVLELDSGFKKLKKAANKGHGEANYLYGMILLSSKASLDSGIEVLKNLLKKLGPKGITECRINIKSFLYHLWINNVVQPDALDSHEKMFDVGKQGKCDVVGIENGWISDDEKEFITASCDLCMWVHEAKIFYNILKRFYGYRS